MSGLEPPGEAKQPDEKPKLPPSTPGLVFKPDARRTALVARVRMLTIAAAVILMSVALGMLMFYRPPVVLRSSPAVEPKTFSTTESLAAFTPPPAAVQPPAAPRKLSTVDVAQSAVAAIDTLVTQATDEWLRASELSPQSVVTSDNADSAAAKLQRAAILADSARREITLARQQAEFVLEASRQAESDAAFRLSILYTASDRYLRSMAEDAGDRFQYYSKSEASVKAVTLGDKDESEIQQNAANGYMRSSEELQPSIRRLATDMHESLRNIQDAGR